MELFGVAFVLAGVGIPFLLMVYGIGKLNGERNNRRELGQTAMVQEVGKNVLLPEDIFWELAMTLQGDPVTIITTWEQSAQNRAYEGTTNWSIREGNRQAANYRRLIEICKKRCIGPYHAEDVI